MEARFPFTRAVYVSIRVLSDYGRKLPFEYALRISQLITHLIACYIAVHVLGGLVSCQIPVFSAVKYLHIAKRKPLTCCYTISHFGIAVFKFQAGTYLIVGHLKPVMFALPCIEECARLCICYMLLLV